MLVWYDIILHDKLESTGQCYTQLHQIHSSLLKRSLISHLRFVRVVYIKCSDSDGSFDAPDGVENTLDTALQKLRFNALLMQTFMAQEMNRHGFGYQTFQLEEDDTDDVFVHVFTSQLTTKKAHGMNGDELYAWFYKGDEDSMDCFFVFEKDVQKKFHVSSIQYK